MTQSKGDPDRRKAREGDWLRFHKVWQKDITDPVWLYVLHENLAVYLCGGDGLISLEPMPQAADFGNPPFNESDTAGMFVDNPDDVPDEVLALLAKWRLSQ